jgi:phage FluMu protein Com
MNDNIRCCQCDELIARLFASVEVNDKLAKSSVGAPDPLAENAL